MAGPHTVTQNQSLLHEALADARDTARDQIAAAWQLYIDRVQEQLAAGWRDQIERVFEERFTELADRLESEFHKSLSNKFAADMETAVSLARGLARREQSEFLNQSARRLRQSADLREWSAALLDAAADFCETAAVFTLNDQTLRCEALRAPENDGAAALAGQEVPLTLAAAFANAADSRDTVVALKTAGELSEPVAAALGVAGDRKVYLFPLTSRERTVAVLYAEGGDQPVDANALELLSALAAAPLEAHVLPAARSAAGLVAIAGAQPQTETEPSGWASLSREEQDLHLRAQRFARVQVAEMRLYKADAVKSGRAARDLYAALRDDIDAGRQAFQSQFVDATPTMVDYFHLELVRTLANDDVSSFGPDYPGPLV